MTSETRADVLAVMDHVVAVYISMANRGAYPAELMHDDDRNDGKKLFLGVQGFADVVQARGVLAELLDACGYMSRFSEPHEWARFHEALSRIAGEA